MYISERHVLLLISRLSASWHAACWERAPTVHTETAIAHSGALACRCHNTHVPSHVCNAKLLLTADTCCSARYLGSAAFARGWDITLVILAAIPVLGIVIGGITYFTNKITSEQSDSYGIANGIASEALAAIRTVLSFNGEERTVRRYGMSLTRPMQVGIKAGALNGLTIGSAQCFFMCGYALALWYGGLRVRAGKYTGIHSRRCLCCF